MTHPHDDPAVEPDPTGMRDLLSRLPDPGPMPDELVARITAALAAEARAGSTPAEHPAEHPVGHAAEHAVEHPAEPAAERPAAADAAPVAVPGSEGPGGGRVLPLPRRSTRLRHLGVAAAVVAALGLGGYGLAVVQGGGTASIGAAGGGSDSGSEASDEAADTRADAGAESPGKESAGSAGSAASGSALGSAPAPGSGEVVVVMSGTDHTTQDLRTTARAVAEGPLVPLAELAAEAPAIGPIGTPLGARSCADALGVPRSAGLLVDVAEVDGRPAAVLVAFEESGRTAYVVERSCTTGTTGPVSGPVSLE